MWLLVANAAAGSNPTGPAGGDLTGSAYPNPVIAALAVTTGKINDLAVTTGKLADNSVTGPAKIVDGTIVHGDVAAAEQRRNRRRPLSLRTLGTGEPKQPQVMILDSPIPTLLLGRRVVT